MSDKYQKQRIEKIRKKRKKKELKPFSYSNSTNVSKDIVSEPTQSSFKSYNYRYLPDGSKEITVVGSWDGTLNHRATTMRRVGTRTTNFKLKKAQGKLPCNPFDFELINLWRCKGSAGVEVTLPGTDLIGSRLLWDGCGVADFSVGDQYLNTTCLEPEDRNDVVREAKKRALDELGNQKVNVAQFIAERKQTMNLIAESAQKIAGFILALKKGNIVEAGKALGARPSRKIRRGYRELYPQSPRDAVSNAWLQLQYGVLPLLSDVYGAVEIMSQNTSDYQRFLARSKAKRHRHTTLSIKDLYGHWDVISTSHVVCKHSYMFDVRQYLSSTMASVGLTNPALLAWELLPYSFVADWFLPIGSYLQSLDAITGLSFQTGSQALYEKHTTTVSWSPHPPQVLISPWGNRTRTSFGYFRGKKETVNLKRIVLTDFPKPELPSFKNPFSVTHVANALALLNNAVNIIRSKR